MKKVSNLITQMNAGSSVVESYKMFRTNLEYTGIDKDKRVVMFTSASSEEGKTTSICNLGISFAQSGKKTLIVECDLRKARVHDAFEIPKDPGLTTILAQKAVFNDVVNSVESIPNLDIITAGPLPPSPAELLGSESFASFIEGAKNVYDLILIDAPPVLVVTDALIINKIVDGVVLIVASNETKKSTLKKALKNLEQVEAPLAGILITKADMSSGKYYDYRKEGYYTDSKPKHFKLFSRRK